MLCCQSGLVATLATPMRARGDRSEERIHRDWKAFVVELKCSELEGLLGNRIFLKWILIIFPSVA
jgi:hypothetical protein